MCYAVFINSSYCVTGFDESSFLIWLWTSCQKLTIKKINFLKQTNAYVHSKEEGETERKRIKKSKKMGRWVPMNYTLCKYMCTLYINVPLYLFLVHWIKDKNKQKLVFPKASILFNWLMPLTHYNVYLLLFQLGPQSDNRGR